MKKLKKFFVTALLLLAAFGFLATITELPIASAGGGTFCDEGKELYCWTSIPYWLCLSEGGTHCADPVEY